MLPTLASELFSTKAVGLPPSRVYFSHELSAAEQNYDIRDWELLAMKAAFEECFTSLPSANRSPELRVPAHPRQARWLLFKRFDFTITYCPGLKKVKANALSRQHELPKQCQTKEPIIPPTIIIATVQCDIMSEIANTQTHDPLPPDKTHVLLLLHKKVIHWVYCSLSSGHPGIAATCQLVGTWFWWSTLQTDIINYIQNCPLATSVSQLDDSPLGYDNC